jgi:glycosyltransferase involved in cell wall biosynthesis
MQRDIATAPHRQSARPHRMRVLTIIDSLGVGGAESSLPILLRHLDREQFDMYVLALRAVPSNHVLDMVARESRGLVQWPGRRLPSLERVLLLGRQLRRGEFDLVHTHLLYSNVHGSTAARLAGVPHVATLHNLRPSRERPVALAKWAVEVAALRANAGAVIAVAEEVGRAYSEPWGVDSRKITVIPNAVDLERFRVNERLAERTRTELLAGASGPLVVAVGRVGALKGFDVLARAAGRLRNTHPELRVVIAGRDATDAGVVRQAIAGCGVGDIVRLVGQRADIPQLLAAADAFALPSIWEGGPIALLEAMAAGVPVVASSIGGIPEVVADGVNGRLVPAGDDEALARALGEVLAHPEQARCLAAAGRETVQQYGAVGWARRIEAVYRSVAGLPEAPLAKHSVKSRL